MSEDNAVNRSRLGRRSKNKGSSYERALASKFEEAYGEEFVRTPSSGGFAKNKRGEAVDFRGDIVPVDSDVQLMVHIEAKSHKALSLREWIRQSESDCPENRIPLVIFHRYRTSLDYVALSLSNFYRLVGVYDIETFKSDSGLLLYLNIHSSARWRVLEWIDETEQKCENSGRVPVTVLSSSDNNDYVVINLKDFFRLVDKKNVVRRG